MTRIFTLLDTAALLIPVRVMTGIRFAWNNALHSAEE